MLYLNLEEFSGFDTLLLPPAGANLSDLFYLICQGKEQVFSRLPDLVREADGFDYIAPAAAPEDLELLEESMWEGFFEELDRMSRYERLVLDLGRSIKEMEMLLPYCQRIFVPVQRDKISAAKLAQFKSIFYRKGGESLVGRMQDIEVPITPQRTQGVGWEGRISPTVEAYAGRVWEKE